MASTLRSGEMVHVIALSALADAAHRAVSMAAAVKRRARRAGDAL